MRILLIDGHSFFAQGLRYLLEDSGECVQLVTCDGLDEALQISDADEIDVILLEHLIPVSYTHLTLPTKRIV